LPIPMRIALTLPVVALALNGQTSGFLISTVAGSGWIGDGGPATQAILRQPGGVAADANGNVYIAETGGYRVRKIDRSGAITTLAGTGVAGFSGDGGPAAQAQLTSPYGVTADIYGNIYIADLGNARVRRVGLDGNITTVAGGGTLDPSPANEGMPGASMRLLAPRNLLADDQGNLYFSDFVGHRVFQLSAAGLLTTVAGTGSPGYLGDGGPAAMAQLDFPAGLAMGFDGSLYIADSANHAVRRISNGVISTFALAGTPVGLALDVLATLYVADAETGTVLRFPLSGTLPYLNIPASDVARAPDLSLYFAESAAGIVQRIPLSGGIALAAGGADPARGDGGAATVALLNHPSGVAADASGNLYIADRDNHRLRSVAADGTIATIAPTITWSAPSGVSVDAAGNIYAVDTGLNQVVQIAPVGTAQAIAPNLLIAPVTAVADALGNIYIADPGASSIREVDPSGAVSTLVGNL
jgi:sugar lactone lactonase YvrE